MSCVNPTPALTDDQMARFWTKVDKTGDCWEWTAAKDRNGYPLWTPPKASGARMGMAHRFSLAHAAGETIPTSADVDHLCRNKGCVNPEHLEPVSHQENVRRAFAGRTHCAQGHERTPENWVPKKSSGRHYCRACSREAARRRQGYYERRAA